MFQAADAPQLWGSSAPSRQCIAFQANSMAHLAATEPGA
jgi:hypothetical protein